MLGNENSTMNEILIYYFYIKFIYINDKVL